MEKTTTKKTTWRELSIRVHEVYDREIPHSPRLDEIRKRDPYGLYKFITDIKTQFGGGRILKVKWHDR